MPLRLHPVIGGACLLLGGGADESPALNSCNVVDGGAVEIAIGQKLLIELYHFAGRASLCTQSLDLLVAAVYPDDFVGLHEINFFIDP